MRVTTQIREDAPSKNYQGPCHNVATSVSVGDDPVLHSKADQLGQVFSTNGFH